MTEQTFACLACGSTKLDRQDGRLDTGDGSSQQRLALLVCRRCKLVMPFLGTRTPLD